MRLLCDGNIDSSMVQYLRDKGVDIVYMGEIQRGAKDIELILKSEQDGRIIMTKDKDFSNLVFLSNYKSSGMILLKLDEDKDHSEFIFNLLKQYKNKFKNNFFVISSKYIKIKSIE